MIGGWLPQWVVEAILPVAFAVIALRFFLRAGGRRERGIALLGLLLLGVVLWIAPAETAWVRWSGIALLVVALPFGAPIFVVLGGLALVLFYADGVPIASIPVETYRSVVSPSIPTLPLFTLTGFLLAEGGFDLAAPAVGITPVRNEQFSIPEYESARNAYPREVRQKKFNLNVYQLDRVDQAPPVLDLDIGGFDDPWVLRMFARQEQDGVTYRWVRDRSFVGLLGVPASPCGRERVPE